ncbi:MAG: hypothetical protein ACKVOE_09885 [Rickettsiales bacterium]
MDNKIANPLSQLAPILFEQVKPSTSQRPVPSELARTASDSIDSGTAKLWIRQHLLGQQSDALSGNGEQYRPEELEAWGVPLSTEIPGFIMDFEGSLRRNFTPHLPDRARDGYHHSTRGSIAERFYTMAANVKSFRGAGTHEFITCLELADRFDPNIKYRLAEQIVQEEREGNNGDEAEYSPSREGARARQIVGLIDGIIKGKIFLHPKEAPEVDDLAERGPRHPTNEAGQGSPHR